jgi:hypothetical protein
MGFTIANYSLFGLQNVQNLYVTIKGSYSVRKQTIQNTPTCYLIQYTYNIMAAPNGQLINQQTKILKITSLPNPVDLYSTVYDNIKSILDVNYGTSQQTLQFTDDL